MMIYEYLHWYVDATSWDRVCRSRATLQLQIQAAAPPPARIRTSRPTTPTTWPASRPSSGSNPVPEHIIFKKIPPTQQFQIQAGGQDKDQHPDHAHRLAPGGSNPVPVNLESH